MAGSFCGKVVTAAVRSVQAVATLPRGLVSQQYRRWVEGREEKLALQQEVLARKQLAASSLEEFHKALWKNWPTRIESQKEERHE